MPASLELLLEHSISGIDHVASIARNDVNMAMRDSLTGGFAGVDADNVLFIKITLIRTIFGFFISPFICVCELD